MEVLDAVYTKPAAITEINAQKIVSSKLHSQSICWIRDLDGKIVDTTVNFNYLVTNRKLDTPQKINKQHEYKLHTKENRHYFKIWNLSDNTAQQNEAWYGILPTFWKGELLYSIGCKIPIFDRTKKIIGIFGQLIQIMNSSSFDSLKKSIFDCNTIFLKDQFKQLEFNSKYDNITLSSREAECLFYTLRGKSAKGIALILNLSPKTIEFYLEQLKNKFNCFSKSQLIDKAIMLGYLNKISRTLITT